MTTRCAVGDLAVFIPPARADICGVFVTVVRFEREISSLLGAPVWWVRTLGHTVPEEYTGKPIRDGFAIDEALKPIRPQPQRETLHLPERVPDRSLA